MKYKMHKNDSFVTFEKCNGWYEVRLRSPNGELHNKVRCDDYRDAMEYWKSFNAIAKKM